MEFASKIRVDGRELARILGTPSLPGLPLEAEEKLAAAAPRWVYRYFGLDTGIDFPLRSPAGDPFLPLPLRLPGEDIRLHLAGCEACCLLAVTLGARLERQLLAAGAGGVEQQVLLDAAASVLTEQYAGAAEKLLRAEAGARGLYLTGRFSPGYGDFPIEVQSSFLAALDAPRSIGLTAGPGNTLMPRKSITAVLGLSRRPVSGRLAGCAGCVLHEKCGAAPKGVCCGKESV